MIGQSWVWCWFEPIMTYADPSAGIVFGIRAVTLVTAIKALSKDESIHLLTYGLDCG